MHEDMDEDIKNQIIRDLNLRIGDDFNYLGNANSIENELVFNRDRLQGSLSIANTEVPTKLQAAIKKAEKDSEVIAALNEKSKNFKLKAEAFLTKSQPLLTELNKRFSAINKLEEVLGYIKTYEKVDNLSTQMKQCHDNEQLVQLYIELRGMCQKHQTGHQAGYIKEYTHYWHNALKDKLIKSYEDILKTLKWPFTMPALENPTPPKEVMAKFTNVTKYLFLIQEPEDLLSSSVTEEFIQDQEPCLPVRVLLRPLKKRFAFHFTGTRQTARIDRPEWFLTQTLTWIKDHQEFVNTNVQPVADKLQLKSVKAVDEFSAGLIQQAAERLHTILASYHTHGIKGDTLDVDAAFAHAVDETLGFHRELIAVTGKENNTVLSVLTRAETFLQWLAVEKKYALAKLDEILDTPGWSAPIRGGAGGVATGDVGGAIGRGAGLWVPRASDLVVTLLSTVEQRYKPLPSPGHRLQFLELQLEVIEEWRVRLTQLVSASVFALADEAGGGAGAGAGAGAGGGAGGRGVDDLCAAVNAAHHTSAVLLQWAHSLHYLQLHYYRRQFQHFTHRQHHDNDDVTAEAAGLGGAARTGGEETDDAMSLRDVELQAKKLALNEVSRRNSIADDNVKHALPSPLSSFFLSDPQPDDLTEESGVFAELPALLVHLRDAGLAALAEHIFLEFKAALKEYKKQKWHAMIVIEEKALTVSASLCRPLAGLCARLNAASKRLAPPLTATLRASLANEVDNYVLQEVVLENWFNTGGTIQISHDIRRNLIPAFAPPNKSASQIKQLPRLMDACRLLNLDYDDARRLRASLTKNAETGDESLSQHRICHLAYDQALMILNQRTDLNQNDGPASVMELF